MLGNENGFRLTSARLRGEIRELKEGLGGIEGNKERFIGLRPRKDVFKSDGNEKQLGFELPKMKILKNKDKHKTSREQYSYSSNYSPEIEINEVTLDNPSITQSEKNIQTLFLKDSKPQISPNHPKEQIAKPLKSPEAYTVNSKLINSTFNSYYEKSSTSISQSKIPKKISSPNLETIPQTDPNTSHSLIDQSNSLILQIKSLHQENQKLHQRLKNPAAKPIHNKPSNNSRSSSPASNKLKKSLTPRQQHCPMCDLLLSKGYSTVHCSKHSFY